VRYVWESIDSQKGIFEQLSDLKKRRKRYSWKTLYNNKMLGPDQQCFRSSGNLVKPS